MGCEFEATETTTGQDRQLHVRTICLGNGLGCLVDTPMGFLGCTRRTWLLLQGSPTDPTPRPARARRGKVSDHQAKLV